MGLFQGLLQDFLDALLQTALISKNGGLYENPSQILPRKYWSWTSELSLGSEAKPQARSSRGDFEEGFLHGYVARRRHTVVGPLELSRKILDILHSPFSSNLP